MTVMCLCLNDYHYKWWYIPCTNAGEIPAQKQAVYSVQFTK